MFELIKPNTNYRFVRSMPVAMLISTVLVLGSLALILFKGFNYGIDFAGGVELRVDFPSNATIGEVRSSVESLGIQGVEVVEFMVEGKNVYSIKAKGSQHATDVKLGDQAAEGEESNEDQELPDAAKKILAKLQQDFGADKTSVVSTDMVGPRVGHDLRRKAVYAIAYAMLGILAYLTWRFNYRYAPGAVIALVHDVLITCGFFILMNHELSLTLVAALLTIAGYSVNDTVIIFDRIREGQTTMRGKSIDEQVNQSLNDTLSRTILTSGVTLLSVIALYVFGSEIIKDFALAMTFGIFVGTYSSIYIASPLYIWLEKRIVANRRAAVRKR